jgi:hypothetical protein
VHRYWFKMGVHKDDMSLVEELVLSHA